MDIDLARTFLEIAHSGSFIAAAERLHISQTAVTARVQNLEGQLGCRLFERNRGGAKLTDDGKRFVHHASQLVQAWAAAKRDLPLPRGTDSLINIGAEISLWNPLMLDWLSELRQQTPELAVRAEVGERSVLNEKLKHGALDAILVHQPDYWPGMQIEQLLEEKLVMVRTPTRPEPYIYIDWGEAFRSQHDAALPAHSRTSLTLDLGPLALNYLLHNGGTGYFRTRVIQSHLQDGKLELVPESPEFSYPIYLAYPRQIVDVRLKGALDCLRRAVLHTSAWSQ